MIGVSPSTRRTEGISCESPGLMALLATVFVEPLWLVGVTLFKKLECEGKEVVCVGRGVRGIGDCSGTVE